MLREWSDALPDPQAAGIWRDAHAREALRKLSEIEADLRAGIDSDSIAPTGFYEAMRHFISLRKTIFRAPVSEAAGIDATACTHQQVSCYRPTWYRDGLGRQTDFAYDGSGRLVQETAPADAAGVRRARYLSYGSSATAPVLVRICGIGITCGTAAEIRTEYTYWGNTALPLTETKVDGVTGTSLRTTYTYDAAGRVLSIDGPLPGSDDSTHFRYDVAGRRTWEIGPRGANGLRTARRFTYRDADDKVVATETGTVTDPASATLNVAERLEVVYDARRNPGRETLSASGTIHSLVERSFDERARPLCEARRMNPASFGAVTDACVLGAQGEYGADRITRNHYDAAGQLRRVEKGVGTALRQDYATYDYTVNGRRASVRDANGNVASMGYDGFDRQVRWSFPSRTAVGQVDGSDHEGFGYDAAGNRTWLRKRDGTVITYAYDGLNRMTAKQVPGSASGAAGYSVHYGYDVRDLQTYARFGSASGEGVTHGYDGFGRLVSTTSTMGGVSRILSYRYDAAGNRDRVTHPDGMFFGYEHDAAGRLTSLSEQGATVLEAMGYDGLGRRVSASGGAQQFGYDPIGRLSRQVIGFGRPYDATIDFTYNPASQVVRRERSNAGYAYGGHVPVSRSYAVNGLNQYTSAGPAAFSYDANGNLVSDGSTSFVYDAENRLVQAGGNRSAQLSYDPLGRLWQVTGPQGTTRFLYDGDELVAEYDAGGSLLRRYVHGAGVDDPVAWYEGAGVTAANRRHLVSDHQGSVVLVTDGGRNQVAINAYDDYGIPGAGNVGRFQYTGQAWLGELGMYHYKARIYSPTLGRFLQTDPIGYEDQVNLYAYVGNDPVNARDPTGMARVCTAVTGSNVPACVGVDGNGDGNFRDNDLSRSQMSSMPRPITEQSLPIAVGIYLGWANQSAVVRQQATKL